MIWSTKCLGWGAVGFAMATALFVVIPARAQDAPKLWVDSTARDTFSCAGLLIRLVDYDRDDKWFGHVFELRVTNRADSSVQFDPAMFQALIRDGTQQSFLSSTDLTQRALSGYWGKHDLHSPADQERKRAELQSRRDLTAEGILPGASSVKRIALGAALSGGLAIGGRGAEQLKEYKASDLPLTLYCHGRRVGVVSKPMRD